MSHSIQFVPAILITLNIMLGSGLFMNTTELALRAGSLGFLAYIVVGLLMLPLVIGMAKLVELHPSGGFYTFAAQELYPLLGFFSAWTYFVGKLASASLMIHTAVVLIQAIFPLFAAVNTLLLDCLLITFFCMLNTLNVRIGSFIQYFFFVQNRYLLLHFLLPLFRGSILQLLRIILCGPAFLPRCHWYCMQS